ncbi:MAG: DUF1461 domain-containing protein [[Clostridium] scindens]
MIEWGWRSRHEKNTAIDGSGGHAAYHYIGIDHRLPLPSDFIGSEYKFYQKEYEKYTVCDALGMKMEDVMQVTEHMMAYLIGEEEELSVITTVEGEKKDFFNEQDRLHMADVKNLFLGGLKVKDCLPYAGAGSSGDPDSDERGLEIS